MRFVPIKSVEQQAALALHRTRDLLVRQRTQLVNMIRELLAEFGIDIPKGITNALAFVRRAVAGEANEVPDLAAKVIGALAEQAIEVQCRIRQLERDLLASFRSNDLARRIATVPGVGLLGATGHSGHRQHSVPLWASVRGLARVDAAEQLQRRQGAPRSDLQDGRSIPAASSGHRHDVARQTQQASPRLGRPSHQRAARPQTVPACDRRHGKPSGPSNLGHYGPWRDLPDSGARLGSCLRTSLLISAVSREEVARTM